jgi:hypothetical protein
MVLEAVSESMKPATPRPLTLALVFSSVLPFAACGVDVHEVGTGKNVDIKSPMGSVSVRTDVDGSTSGLSRPNTRVPMTRTRSWSSTARR